MDTFKYILSIGIAAGAGVVAGILFAPKSGKKTRSELVGEFEEAKSTISDAANKKLKEAKVLLNESVEKQINQGKAVLNKAKKELAK